MDKTAEETNLQAFVRTLYAAYDASKRVDYFDLKSDDPASERKWVELVAVQREAFRELHEVCRKMPVEELSEEL